MQFTRADAGANLDQFYDMGHELGRGHFGVVRLCREHTTGVQFACKSIRKDKIKVCASSVLYDSCHSLLVIKLFCTLRFNCLTKQLEVPAVNVG